MPIYVDLNNPRYGRMTTNNEQDFVCFLIIEGMIQVFQGTPNRFKILEKGLLTVMVCKKEEWEDKDGYCEFVRSYHAVRGEDFSLLDALKSFNWHEIE